MPEGGQGGGRPRAAAHKELRTQETAHSECGGPSEAGISSEVFLSLARPESDIAASPPANPPPQFHARRLPPGDAGAPSGYGRRAPAHAQRAPNAQIQRQ